MHERSSGSASRRDWWLIVLAITALGLAPPAYDQHVVRIRCLPTALYAGDTLLIVTPKPHPAELGITAPGDKFYGIAGSDTNTVRPPGSITPPDLMLSSVFQQMDTLRLATSTLEGVPWIAGAMRQRIFSAPGTYRLDLAADLHTDTDVPVYSCTVHYVPHSRPSRP